MPQRLRKSRTARQSRRPTSATSDAQPFLAVDATKVTAGHRKPRTAKVPALSESDKQRILALDPNATFAVVRKGRSNAVRADIATYYRKGTK